MSVSRSEAIKILEEISLLLQLKGENTFKIRAYENAARTLSNIDTEFDELVTSGGLVKLKGFGKALVEKLTELSQTGKLDYLEKLRAEFPPSLFEMMKLQGLGPKKVKLFYDELNITSIDELENACNDGRLEALSGMGAKSVELILKANPLE